MKSFVRCTFGMVCGVIPGGCIVLQMIRVVARSGVLGYVCVTLALRK